MINCYKKIFVMLLFIVSNDVNIVLLNVVNGVYDDKLLVNVLLNALVNNNEPIVLLIFVILVAWLSSLVVIVLL